MRVEQPLRFVEIEHTGLFLPLERDLRNGRQHTLNKLYRRHFKAENRDFFIVADCGVDCNRKRKRRFTDGRTRRKNTQCAGLHTFDFSVQQLKSRLYALVDVIAALHGVDSIERFRRRFDDRFKFACFLFFGNSENGLFGEVQRLVRVFRGVGVFADFVARLDNAP